jgi:serine/threonine protein kinase
MTHLKSTKEMNSNSIQLPSEIEEAIKRKYKVIGKCGQGGAGDIYRVKQLGLDVDRALKVLRPERKENTLFTRTFQIEIKLLSELTHKNVIKILDAGSSQKEAGRIQRPDFDFYIMELVETGSLNEYPLKKESDAINLIQIFDQIIDGIVYLHARDILHFDIKPTNIMVWHDENGANFEAKISDLGTAIPLKVGNAEQMMLREASRDTTQTYAFGTDRYLPAYARDFLGESIERKTLLPFKSHIVT